jgi:hypothetical protein
LRHHAHALHHAAGETGDAHLQALHVGFTVLISLRYQPPICVPVLPAEEVDDAVAFVELAQQLAAAALVHPCSLLARGQAERNRAVEGEGGVLAEIVVGRCVAHFHRAVLHRVHYLEAGHDFACRELADHEFAAGELGHALYKLFGRTVDGVQRFGEAGGKAPVDGGLRLGEGWSGQRGCACAGGGFLQEGTALHRRVSSKKSGSVPNY